MVLVAAFFCGDCVMTKHSVTEGGKMDGSKPIEWGVEHRGRVGNLSDQPQYFIAEHPCGAELHVWISVDDVDRWTQWFFEVKGKRPELCTPFAYESGQSERQAKAAALEYLLEKLAEEQG